MLSLASFSKNALPMQKLQQWHQLHYWNNEITQEPSGALQEAVVAE